jgi:CheY-like chemotaxis protein
MVSNGTEAVQQARMLPYDVLLLDVNMPEMSGLEAAKRIRSSRGRNANTPIIAITANALKGDRERCIAAGMDDYISKPINAGELFAKLARWAASGRKEELRTGT